MNKSILTSILALAVAASAATAEAASTYRNIGYVTTDQIDVSGAIFGTPGNYTIGARLTPDVLGNYVGCEVVGMRLASALDLGRTSVHLYSLNPANEMTEVKSQKQRIYEGWNDIYFNGTDNYVITAESDLFYCFDYTETQEMIDAEKGAVSAAGYDQTNSFLAFNGKSLLDVSGVGALCIQLIVDVSNLPADNLGFTYFDTGFKYKTTDENMEIYSNLSNIGLESVENFEVTYDFDGGDKVTLAIDTLKLRPGGSGTLLHNIPLNNGIGIGAHTLNVRVTKVNGKDLTAKPNSQRSVNFAIYKNHYAKSRAYVEVYGNQSSYLSQFLNTGINVIDDETARISTIVNINAAGGSLAIDDAQYLHSLYAYTYPCFTINRSYFPGESHVAYDINDYLLMFPAEMTSGIIGDMIYQDYFVPAFATIELTGQYNDNTRELTVYADGDLLEEAKAIYGEPALTLMIVEDGVTAKQAIIGEDGRAMVNDSYLHNNVLRGYITSPKGDKINDTDLKYSMEYKTVLDKKWNEKNVRIVGIISKALDDAKASNIKDYDVTNATEMDVASLTGVDEIIGGDNETTVTVYTLQGIRILYKADRSALENLPKGIYIVNGKKIAF